MISMVNEMISISIRPFSSVPLVPYMFTSNAQFGLIISACVTVFSLFIFGYTKAVVLGTGSPLSKENELFYYSIIL